MTKFGDYCLKIGFKPEVVEFEKSTRTAAEAAEALKCDINQIGKSIVFNNLTSGEPLLVVVAGGNRADEQIIEKQFGWKIEKMEANNVLISTGFPIGGVAPLGHKTKIKTLMDNKLFDYEYIWVAAGKVNAVFKITPAKLKLVTEAEVINLR